MVKISRGKKRNEVFILREFEWSREPQISKGVFLTCKLLGRLCATRLSRPLEREPALVLQGLRQPNWWACLQQGLMAPVCMAALWDQTGGFSGGSLPSL